MVFYRKYRPQTISQLDTDSVREKLKLVLSGESFPHAFLFTGPKGAGKTSAARIVAKTINCERLASSSKEKKLNAKRYEPNADIEPCNKCDQCVSITDGTSLDVLEIDGASNRGIDEMRDLREKVKLSPSSAKKKVYIIDEVHMLTTEAFNALLKTIEEPPSHVVFILCTTELHKVPVTIISRCFQVAFTKATNDELVRSLERIVKGEKIEIEKEALLTIADFAGGGFRDGAKILEEIVLSSNGAKITKEKIETLYHSINISSYIEKMLEFLVNKQPREALILIEDMAKNETDMMFFISTLLEKLHQILLEKIGVGEKSSSFEFSLENISSLSEMLMKAYVQTKTAVIPQLPLELVVVEWGKERVSASLPQDVSDARVASEKSSNLTQSSLSESRSTVQKDKIKADDGSALNSLTPAQVSPQQENKNSMLWKELIEKVKEENFSLAGVLRGCSVSSYNEKELVIETKFKFHKEKLEEEKAIVIIKKVIKEISGNSVIVSIVQK